MYIKYRTHQLQQRAYSTLIEKHASRLQHGGEHNARDAPWLRDEISNTLSMIRILWIPIIRWYIRWTIIYILMLDSRWLVREAHLHFGSGSKRSSMNNIIKRIRARTQPFTSRLFYREKKIESHNISSLQNCKNKVHRSKCNDHVRMYVQR